MASDLSGRPSTPPPSLGEHLPSQLELDRYSFPHSTGAKKLLQASSRPPAPARRPVLATLAVVVVCLALGVILAWFTR